MRPSQIISNILSEIPADVTLVAVSKYHPADMIADAYAGGQRVFGESHVQELQVKQSALPGDIKWHFIGHLQTNKVKYIAPYIHLIHSIDSPHLLAEVNKHALRFGRQIDCLLQLHLAQEETKFGFAPDELVEYLASDEFRQMQGIRIRGLMCMASNVDDEGQIANEFSHANTLFYKIKEQFFPTDSSFDTRSWGMSDDYPIAIRYGSNMIRVGSKIFGQRVY